MRGGVPLRSRQRNLERPPGTGVIPEREAADPDVHEEPRQVVVQSRRSLERCQCLLVPVLLLQGESAELMPQGQPFARKSESLRDGLSAPVAAARVCPAEREQDRGLVGPEAPVAEPPRPVFGQEVDRDRDPVAGGDARAREGRVGDVLIARHLAKGVAG